MPRLVRDGFHSPRELRDRGVSHRASFVRRAVACHKAAHIAKRYKKLMGRRASVGILALGRLDNVDSVYLGKRFQMSRFLKTF